VSQDYDQGAFVDLVPDMLKRGDLLPPVGQKSGLRWKPLWTWMICYPSTEAIGKKTAGNSRGKVRSQIRSTNLEIRNKSKFSRSETCLFAGRFRILRFRICFEFRYSNFGSFNLPNLFDFGQTGLERLQQEAADEYEKGCKPSLGYPAETPGSVHPNSPEGRNRNQPGP